MTRDERMIIMADTLWQWFASHKRDLPWRDLALDNDTERAYQILVSEIMLQQTQVERVKIVFKNFLEQFPTMADLAAADNAAVITAWRGMGYNSRALRLRDAARHIVHERAGEFPTDLTDLVNIPGIGHYTAAAIRNFAFNLPTACLDTNIRRIIHRVFIGPENPDGSYPTADETLLKIATGLLAIAEQSGFDARNWHACLMDYGALVCVKRSPKWDQCPLTQAGVMKAAYKVQQESKVRKKEPGRLVGSTFVPNRIFRGKVVEELRDHPGGLTLADLGQRVCLDWTEQDHAEWLQTLVNTLIKDHLVTAQCGRYTLSRS